MPRFLTRSGGYSITAEDDYGVLTTSSIELGYDSDSAYSSGKVFDAGSIIERDGSLFKANSDIDVTSTPFEEGKLEGQWTKLAGGGGGISQYDSDETYRENDLVVKDNVIYIANGDRDGNPVFKVATDSDSWSAIGQSFMSGGDSGQILGDGSSLNNETYGRSASGSTTSTWQAIPGAPSGLRFTAKTSGRYRVFVQGNCYGDASTVFREVGFVVNYSSGDAPLAENKQLVRNATPNGDYFEFSCERYLDLKAGDNVIAVFSKNNTNSDANDFFIYNHPDRGFPYFSWEKVTDFVPAIGLKAEYMHAKITSRINYAPGSFIGYFTDTENKGIEWDSLGYTVKLKAGTTYKLTAAIMQDGVSVQSAGVGYEWRDTLNNRYGNVAFTQSANYSSYYSSQPTAVAIITPSIDISVGVMCTGETAATATDTEYGYMTVEAIANHAPIYKDYAAEYQQFGLSSADSWGTSTVARNIRNWKPLVGTGVAKVTGTNDDTIVIQEDGTYKVHATFGLNSTDGSSETNVDLYVNGSAPDGYGKTASLVTPNRTSSSDGAMPLINIVLELSKGDTLSFWNRALATGNRFGTYDTTVTIEKIANRLPITNSDKLGGLSDVDTTGNVDGQTLFYNATEEKWVSSSNVTVKYDGNVGIGSNTPHYSLDLDGNVADNFAASFGSTYGIGEWSGFHFGYSESSNTDYRKSGMIFERTDGAARGKVHIINNNDFDASTATLADAKMTISHDGNVGVGTTNPTYKLDVDSGDGFSRFGPNDAFGKSLFVGGWHGGTGLADGAYIGTSNGNLHLDASTISGAQDIYLNHYHNGNVHMAGGGGNVGIGTVTPQAKLHVSGTATGLGGNPGRFFKFDSSGLEVGASSSANSIYATSDIISNSWVGVISDVREKENIEDIGYGLEAVMNIRPTEYTKKNFVEHTHGKELGFIAQELKEVVPEVVTQMKGDVSVMKHWDDFTPEDGVTYTLVIKDKEGETKWTTGDVVPEGELFVVSKEVDDKHAVNYDAVVPVLVKAIQELKAEIDILKDLIPKD